MKAWGVTIDEVRAAVTVASTKYDGNIVFKREPEKEGKAVRFTLTVWNSRNPGSRMSPSGRRIAACCWHGHRDVMKAVFAINPDARIKTALADYRGLDDFDAKYEDTGRTNIGSQMEPMDIEDACNCAMWKACDDLARVAS
jgi:hypothetical protein